MRIVTTTSVFPCCYNAESAMERLAEIGFCGLDLAIDYCVQKADYPFMTADWRDWGKRLFDRALELGVSYTHAHASSDAAARDVPFLRGFELCGLMKIPYIVVHPVFRDKDGNVFENADEFIERNVREIRPLLEYAEANDVVILSENLLWGASADPAVIGRLVQEVRSPWFGWCYDTGHAHCCGFDSEVLTKIPVVPLSLHIQDNCGKDDSHLIPGDGTIEWDKFLRVLKRIHYRGDFVLEAHHQSLECEDNKRHLVLQRLYKQAKQMAEQLANL